MDMIDSDDPAFLSEDETRPAAFPALNAAAEWLRAICSSATSVVTLDISFHSRRSTSRGV
jgi:hypothetical protein